MMTRQYSTTNPYSPLECADLRQNVANRDLGQAVIRYDKKYPNRFKTSFAELVADALMDALPCKR
jgi:hypothetical protein